MIKYEDVVLNFEQTIKSLMNFLNLEWENSLKDFNKKAQERIKINTPSYSQVIKPLYNKSINRWKKYEIMDKFYPLLEKWIKEFNY